MGFASTSSSLISEVHVRLPENMKSKHLKVKITNNSIDVFSSLENRQILSGQLSEKCKASDAVWTITEGNKLNICFGKRSIETFGLKISI